MGKKDIVQRLRDAPLTTAGMWAREGAGEIERLRVEAAYLQQVVNHWRGRVMSLSLAGDELVAAVRAVAGSPGDAEVAAMSAAMEKWMACRGGTNAETTGNDE